MINLGWETQYFLKTETTNVDIRLPGVIEETLLLEETKYCVVNMLEKLKLFALLLTQTIRNIWKSCILDVNRLILLAFRYNKAIGTVAYRS